MLKCLLNKLILNADTRIFLITLPRKSSISCLLIWSSIFYSTLSFETDWYLQVQYLHRQYFGIIHSNLFCQLCCKVYKGTCTHIWYIRSWWHETVESCTCATYVHIFWLALIGAQYKYMQHGSFTSQNLLTISGILFWSTWYFWSRKIYMIYILVVSIFKNNCCCKLERVVICNQLISRLIFILNVDFATCMNVNFLI